MSKHLLWLLLWVGLLAAAGSGGAQTPSEVVKDAYRLAKEGKYLETEKYLSTEVLRLVKSEAGIAFGGGIQGMWDEETRKGTVERLEVIKEEVKGDQATVLVNKTFLDGREDQDDVDLIKQGGAWKITKDTAREGARAQRRAEENAKAFLTALQADDFKTLFGLVDYYLHQVNEIEKSNPKVLWPKLTEEYSERERKNLLAVDDGFLSANNTTTHPERRPIAEIQQIAPLLKHSPTWKIIESKSVKAGPSYSPHDVVAVYVTLEYKSATDAPVLKRNPLEYSTGVGREKQKILKSALLQLNFLSTGGCDGAARITAGDVYWNDPPTSAASVTQPSTTAPQPAIGKQAALVSAAISRSAGLKEVCPNGKLGEFRHGTKCTGYYDSKGLVDITLAGKESTKEYSKTKGLVHAGVDIAAPAGSEIYPIADGVVDDVVTRDKDENFGTLGYMVLVEHSVKVAGKATYSLYLHMQEKPAVAVGDKVMAGKTLLGKVGSTGAATGIHTHIEVRQFAGRFSPKWVNIYGIERPKDAATFDEKDFSENWIDPEKFDGTSAVPSTVAVAPAPTPETANAAPSLNGTPTQPQVLPILNPEQVLKDYLTSSQGTVRFNVLGFGKTHKGRKFRYSGEVEKVNEASGTITFKPVGQGDNRGTVEATLATADTIAGGVVQPKATVTVEGVVSEFAFGKAPLVGRAPRIIKMSGAVLVK